MSDLIRREDALKALLKVPCKIDSDNYAWIRLSDAFGTVDENVPSAEPERTKGKWKKIGHWGRHYRCDQCGNTLDFDGVNAGRGDANFCPNCGADLRGE